MNINLIMIRCLIVQIQKNYMNLFKIIPCNNHHYNILWNIYFQISDVSHNNQCIINSIISHRQPNDSEYAYKWHKIELKLPQPTCYRYMLTNNEKFIIAASEQEIIYHELGADKWIKSEMQSPSISHRHISSNNSWLGSCHPPNKWNWFVDDT